MRKNELNPEKQLAFITGRGLENQIYNRGRKLRRAVIGLDKSIKLLENYEEQSNIASVTGKAQPVENFTGTQILHSNSNDQRGTSYIDNSGFIIPQLTLPQKPR